MLIGRSSHNFGVLIALLCLLGSCGGEDISTGGGVIIPTPSIEEPVEVGAVGAGLPGGFIQKTACTIQANVDAGLLSAASEDLRAVLTFSDTGIVNRIEQRFLDTASSNLNIKNSVIDFTYEEDRLVHILENDEESGSSIQSDILYAGGTSLITAVVSTSVDDLGSQVDLNLSREYDDDNLLTRYEDLFDDIPLLFTYSYDKLSRLERVDFNLNHTFPFRLAEISYSKTGFMNTLKFPVFQLCATINYDENGFAMDSMIGSCSEEDAVQQEVAIAFDGCHAKAIAFWVMYTLNAY